MADPVTGELSIWLIAIFVLGPSAFGGVLQGWHRHYRMTSGEASVGNGNVGPSRGLTRTELWLVAPGFGIGGGVAALLATIWLNKLSIEASLENVLSIISVSMVAGFIGYRLLPAIAHNLEERLSVAERTAERAAEMTEEVRRNLQSTGEEIQGRITESVNTIMRDLNKYQEEAKDYSIFSRGMFSADTQASHECRIYASQFARLVERNPTDRGINIVYGRLYRWGGDYDIAIKVLRDFIKRKELKGEGEDIDVADARYNISCYLTQKADNVEGEEKEGLLMEALNELEQSVAIKPENKQGAFRDDDFDPLQEHPRFKELTEN